MSAYAIHGATAALERALEADVVVLPIPGTCGNVGQLACDVLALNLNLARVGGVDFEHLAPVCGRDAIFDDLGRGTNASGALASACEVYAGTIDEEASSSGQRRFACVVQIRSDACVGARRAFCEEYAKFIATHFAKASRIVLCSSLPSTVGESAAQIGGTKWRRCRGNDAFNAACDASELIELEGNARLPAEEMSTSVDPHWSLLDALNAVDGTARVGCLLAVCSEGDNSVDGAGMALAAARCCGIELGKMPKDPVPGETYIGPFRVPRSWDSLFGLRKHRRDMYG